ncbi:MAG: excinuclease ABC subunit A, partial [Deltaproteobacteria bacterium]|nr:excinuclease ABC subunit A [Deltaproteobacteria bacterium]
SKAKAKAKTTAKATPRAKAKSAKGFFADAFEVAPIEDSHKDELIIEGLRQNNLKNIDVTIPHNKITVLCGPSGSGKSSLAFDTLFAEGHWRFMESLSTYTRMFLERMDRPELDKISNIRPAIAIEQKNPVRTSRSTVGTATEINDYLRLLFARAGEVHCPKCNKIVRPSDPITVAEELLSSQAGKRTLIGFDLAIENKDETEIKRVLQGLVERGFIRILAGNGAESIDISDDAQLKDLPLASMKKKKKKKKKISVVVDRVVLKEDVRSRLTDSLETSLKEGSGVGWAVTLNDDSKNERKAFSSALTCTDCEIPLERPRPILFSFNHPLGACDECKGFGNILRYDETKIIPDKSLSLKEGAIEPWTKPAYTWWYEEMERFAARYEVDLDAPFEELSEREREIVYKGTKDFKGIDGFFKELETKKYKLHIRVFLSRFKGQFPCKACRGTRFKDKALNIRINKVNIAELSAMTIEDAKAFFTDLELKGKAKELTKEPLRQIRLKLRFLDQTGLGYITLNRLTKTLSGGEAQRIQLANQLGSALTGVLYILDEPSVGLHPRDV